MMVRIFLNHRPTRLNLDNHSPGQSSLLRLPFVFTKSTGILTCFPSTTHLCLALGADSPYADQHCVGILGLPACVILTRITLLMSAFALLIPPANFSIHLLRLTERSSTPHALLRKVAISVDYLAPLHLPCRPTRPVSYYAFFKSWLLLSQLPGCLRLPTSFPT